MKILRVITRLNVGGPSIQAIYLTRELAKRGHEVKLVAGAVFEHEGYYLEDKAIELNGKDLIFSFVSSLKREVNWKSDYRAFKNLKYIIEDFKPDIIHTHQAKAGAITVFSCLTIPKSKRPKIVHTYHGHTFHSYWDKNKNFLNINIERFLNRFRDKIIAISNSQYSDLVYKYKVSKEYQTEVIELGFDLSKLLKMKSSNIKTLDIGIIGRLTDVKNHELFFEFIKEVQKIYPSTIAWVIGDGERRKYLESIAPRDTYFKGWISKEELYNLYEYILDIIVCTSKNEGTPVSLIEAMAAGKLVISTPVGGCRDLIGGEPGEWGDRGLYLYDCKSTVKELQSYLVTGAYITMVKRAREYVSEKYWLNRLVDNVEKLYTRIKEEL